MCPVTPSSKPNFANSRNAAAKRSLRCRRSSSKEANFGGPGNPGFFTGAVAMFTSDRSISAEYSTQCKGKECKSGKRESANVGQQLVLGQFPVTAFIRHLLSGFTSDAPPRGRRHRRSRLGQTGIRSCTKLR